MLVARGFRSCRGLVGDSLVQIAETEVNKPQKGEAHRVRLNACLLDQCPADIWNTESVNLSEVQARWNKLAPHHQSAAQT